MNKIEVTGKNIEEARGKAAVQLGTDVDEIMYEVIENATSGFFGINAKPCKIAAWIENDVFAEKQSAPKKPTAEKKKQSIEAKAETIGDTNTQSEQSKERKGRVIAQDKTEGKKIAKEFIEEILTKMGIESSLDIEETEESLEITISGENMGMVIGRRGETLDALQYLTSLVVNKDKDEYIRINLDSENYRLKRTQALEKLADKVAEKVLKNKRNLTLEPMNSFERRVIHSRLQGDTRITTYSIGEEPSRRIVVGLSKDR